ncbi:MAG TPA: HAMP domain-containing sensor histidine kinase [Acidimicrobiales bacterium]|jgi:signal transduction histidine kinase|nr:HAMP domain-containing sensor histidine kinase [Acidimicrobiales bacterium]
MSASADLDLLPDAVLHIDADRRIVAANQAAAALTGVPVDRLVGQDVSEALFPRSKDGKPLLDGTWHHSTMLRSVHRLPEHEVTIRRADDEDMRTFVTGRYQRNGDGGLTGAVLALRPAGNRGHQAATGIEIVSTVSHELRSPLTSVKGYTSLLLNRWDRLKDDQKRMMLEQVNHDADRVTRLITELLDISRLESGRLMLRRQMIDLQALASSVVEKVRMEYPELECDLRFPDELPSVYADPDKIVQVLTNLVENACKYASPKGVVVQATIEGDDVCMAVEDKGEGMPETDLSKVFTKFFRRAETKPTGSGLGLWISRGLVEGHGGKLTARSNPGEGTTFRFTLPLHAFEELHQ